MNIDLELDKVAARINAENAKLVCLQLPEGLKPRALDIQKEIENLTSATVIVWMGNAYGACDTPKPDNIDVLVQFGHSEWRA